MSDLIPVQAHSDVDLVNLWVSLQVSPQTKKNYRFAATDLMLTVNKSISALTVSDLQLWIGKMQETLSPGTVATRINSIKSLFGLAVKIGYLKYNPAAVIRVPYARDSRSERILTENEVQAILQAETRPRNHALLSLLYISAVRVSEICALCWRHLSVTSTGAVLTVYGKGGKTRMIHLSPHMVILLGPPQGPDDPLFVSRQGGALNRSQVHRIIKAAARKAGINPGTSAHWFRHAHASHALDRGATLALVQATLGHSSVATTGIYLHIRPGESSGDVLALPKLTGELI